MLELLEEEKIDEMFQYRESYKDSLGEEEEIAVYEELLPSTKAPWKDGKDGNNSLITSRFLHI